MEAARDIPAALAPLAAGGKAALARTLADLERDPDGPGVLALLDAAFAAPRGRTLGITGPPGVGKSTLLGALIALWRSRRLSVGVIAVDPSSKRSGGALLGDRLRLLTDPEDPGVFVRSMAARDRLGGLAEITVAALVLMRALYDLVLVETVGVGQSETDVAGAVDTVVFCVQPGSGDSLQFMKAGIVEVPDISVVTKADLGAPAERALSDLAGALSLGPAGDGWPVRSLKVSAQDRDGLAVLAGAIDDHWRYLGEGGRLAERRRTQAEAWLEDSLRERFGREGLKRVGEIALGPGESPFRRLAELSTRLANP